MVDTRPQNPLSGIGTHERWGAEEGHLISPELRVVATREEQGLAGEIVIENVAKYYGETLVLRNISLSIAKGEFVSVLGPSGCGKTTLLNIIAGFIQPTEGSVYISGKRVNELPPYKRDIGMVFQTYALFPHMTVFDNIAFGMRMRKIDKTEIPKRVKDVLELVRLTGYEKRRPKRLSGGEQQRVALARALAINPSLLLMDEPLSNLDAKLRKEMRVQLKLLQEKVGVTALYVTHDQEEALTMSDRIAIIGPTHQIEQVATPVEAYRNPKTPFVAGFVGESNFFEGRVSTVSPSLKEMTIQTSDGVDLVAESREDLREGNKALVIIRAESLKTSRKATNARNNLIGTVDYVAYVGADIDYVVKLANDRKIMVIEKNLTGKPEYVVGDRIHLSCALTDLTILPR